MSEEIVDTLEIKTRLYSKIEEAGVLHDEDRDDLKQLLSNKTFLKVLAHILDCADDSGLRLTMLDFTEQKQISAAVKIQGVTEGLTQAVELIIDFSLNTKENDNG